MKFFDRILNRGEFIHEKLFTSVLTKLKSLIDNNTTDITKLKSDVKDLKTIKDLHERRLQALENKEVDK